LLVTPADPEGTTAAVIQGQARRVRDLPTLLDRLEDTGGPADPVPSTDGWALVLAENVAYLVDDQRRWQAPADLRRHGQAVCRRKDPACDGCAIAGDCPSAGHPPPLY
jgi:hypothetical protein